MSTRCKSSGEFRDGVMRISFFLKLLLCRNFRVKSRRAAMRDSWHNTQNEFTTIVLFFAQMRGIVERGTCFSRLQRVRWLFSATALPALRRSLPYRMEAWPHHGKYSLWPVNGWMPDQYGINLRSAHNSSPSVEAPSYYVKRDQRLKNFHLLSFII